MSESASKIAESEGQDKKRQVFHECLSKFRISMRELVPDAVDKYKEIVLADPRLLQRTRPCKFIESAVTKKLIRPAESLMWAWFYWVLGGYPLGYPHVLPLAPENLVGREFQLPDWLTVGVHDEMLQMVCDERSTIRGALWAYMTEELEKAAVVVNLAKLKSATMAITKPSQTETVRQPGSQEARSLSKHRLHVERGKDPGESTQRPSAQGKKPAADQIPVAVHETDVSEQSRRITERTYFIIDAEVLIRSHDRPGELVAAYSTNDPYLRDLTLVCFAASSMDLLEKLRNRQADRQKLLIHWGESEKELEQLPDILRAYLGLKETSRTVSGKYIDEAVQNLRSFFEGERKKRGRPRQDELGGRIQELRESGHSWGEIQIQLNKETGIERTIGAYRNLLRSRQKPSES
jgi:hypothetical protein